MRKGLLLLLLALVLPLSAISAQDMMMTASVSVHDQLVTNNHVILDSVYSPGPGFVVIHIDNGGSPGPVAGFAPVAAGMNGQVHIEIDPMLATPTLFAMLHEDTGVVGEYEFGTVEGADLPVRVGEQVVTPAFNIQLVHMHDQFVDGDSVSAAHVVTDAAGWLVIHSAAEGRPGPVLGFTALQAGANMNVSVELAAEGRTSQLFPMLHVDTGVAGEYEFGTVEGADGPVMIGGGVATFPIWTVNHMRVPSQPIVGGDGMQGMDAMGLSVMVDSVLSETAGFVVIHVDNGGSPGAVAGFAPVPQGYSHHIEVPLTGDVAPTAVLFPMLHVDTGVAGEYEFGTVEGADGPAMADGAVVVFPINAAPSLKLKEQALGTSDMGATVVIPEAVIDAPGWLVIHSSVDGAPGPVLGQTYLSAGTSRNVTVMISDAAAAGTQVFPMLHYDTGAAGVYEFGMVEGADSPVFVGGNVVVAPMTITAAAY